MSFDSLRINTYVRLNPLISENWPQLSDAKSWEHEPLDCIFQITHSRNQGKADDSLQLECVKSCGAHLINSIDRDDFERVSSELGADMYVEASTMTEFFDLFAYEGDESEKETGYDLDEDINYIFSVIEGKVGVRKQQCE